jgi:hypothetical protein
MVKLTFTVDEQTVEVLRETATRLKKSQSAVFREAIRDFAERADRLTNEERDRLLSVLDRIRSRKSTRPQSEVDAEIAGIRDDRKTGGRRTRVE